MSTNESEVRARIAAEMMADLIATIDRDHFRLQRPLTVATPNPPAGSGFFDLTEATP